MGKWADPDYWRQPKSGVSPTVCDKGAGLNPKMHTPVTNIYCIYISHTSSRVVLEGKNPLANAGDTGRSHTPQSSYARGPQLLSLRITARRTSLEACSATGETAAVRIFWALDWRRARAATKTSTAKSTCINNFKDKNDADELICKTLSEPTYQPWRRASLRFVAPLRGDVSP